MKQLSLQKLISANKNFLRQNAQRGVACPIKNVIGTDYFSKRQVFFTRKDRERHNHIVGSTGSGKSKLLELFIRSDMKDRKAGLLLIDPHGSTYNDTLKYISHHHPRLAKRIILFNPAGENEKILGFNPAPHSENFHYTLQMLVGAFLKAWRQDDPLATPRISRWLINIFYPLLINRLTLLESAAMISFRNDRRNAILAKVNNPVILEDWRLFDRTPDSRKMELIEGAGNRLRAFLDCPILRQILSQREKVLDIPKAMEEGKIVLVNLSSGGKLSQDNAQLLGIMLINEIYRAGKLRNYNDPKLKPFYVYIDEFAQFVSKDIALGLDEFRKYKTFLTLAHQHLTQLKNEDPYLYASVMTNCKNKIIFGGLSAEDARTMVEETMPGYLNLKVVKDEIYTSKERHIIEWIDVVSKSQSSTQTESSSQTKGLTHSQNQSTGHSDTVGATSTIQKGTALSQGGSEAKGESKTLGTNESFGTNQSWTEGSQRGRSRSKTDGESFNSYESDSHSKSVSDSSNKSSGRNSQTGASRSTKGYISSKQDGEGQHSSFGESHAESRQSGYSTGSGQGEQHSTTEGENESESQSFTKGQNHSHGSNENRGSSLQLSQSWQKTLNDSHSHAEQKSHTESRSFSEGLSKQESQTSGQTKGNTQGESITKQRVLTPQEYQELSSRSFFSLEDIKFMAMAAIKNQDTGQAFVKIGNNAPIRTVIDFVKGVAYARPYKIKEFKERVFAANDFYSTPAEVRQAYEARHRRVFGENRDPLNFDEPHLDLEEKEEVKQIAESQEAEQENIFNGADGETEWKPKQ